MRPRQVRLGFQTLDLRFVFGLRVKPRQRQVLVALRRLHAEQRAQRLPVQHPFEVGRQSDDGFVGQAVGVDVVDGEEESEPPVFSLFFSK